MRYATDKPRYYRGSRVPYVTAWSSEIKQETADPHLVLRTPVPGADPYTAYTDERFGDRSHGVLWARMGDSPGHGTPRFASLHTARQRAVMHTATCQICTAPGELWLAPVSVYERHLSVRGAAAPYETTDPPVCRACLPTAISQCPNLSTRGYVFLAPRRWDTAKVRGFVADPDTLDLGDYTDIALPAHPRHDPRRARLALAKGLLATLHEPHAHTDLRAAGLGPRSGRSAAAFVRRHPKL
jgi:hypothetical protein